MQSNRCFWLQGSRFDLLIHVLDRDRWRMALNVFGNLGVCSIGHRTPFYLQDAKLSSTFSLPLPCWSTLCQNLVAAGVRYVTVVINCSCSSCVRTPPVRRRAISESELCRVLQKQHATPLLLAGWQLISIRHTILFFSFYKPPIRFTHCTLNESRDEEMSASPARFTATACANFIRPNPCSPSRSVVIACAAALIALGYRKNTTR